MGPQQETESRDASAPPDSAGETDPGGPAAALGRARRGDEDAFCAIYQDTQPRLLRYLRQLVGADAEDVASEAWLRIARDLRGFSGDYREFRAWAATIARHRAIDHLRRQGRRPGHAIPIDEVTDLPGRDDTATQAADSAATRAAVTLIAQLPPDQAEAVLLRAVVGLDAATAGRLLGKRAGAVRTATHRGLRRLGALLAPQHPDGAQPDSAHGPPAGHGGGGVTPTDPVAVKESR